MQINFKVYLPKDFYEMKIKFNKNSNDFSDKVINAILQVTGKDKTFLHEPVFIGNEYLYLKECLDTSFVSSIGPFVDKFEKKLSDFTNSQHVISVVNGTAALHLALKVIGVQQRDEVLTPALNFVACANAISYCNAIPHFVDSSYKTLSMCPIRLRDYLKKIVVKKNQFSINKNTGNIIRAMVPMHTFGHPAEMDELSKISSEFNIKLIEDSAESIGSFYKGVHTGTIGDIGIFSFNGNKTITTGGGGAILTNCPLLAKKIKHLSKTAKTSDTLLFSHDEIGYNYRMPNVNAAIGCAQLEKIDLFLNKKRQLQENYMSAFKDINGVELFCEKTDSKSNYWLQTIILKKDKLDYKDTILKKSSMLGIGARPVWKLISSLKMYKKCPRANLSVAKYLEKALINLPSSTFLVK